MSRNPELNDICTAYGLSGYDPNNRNSMLNAIATHKGASTATSMNEILLNIDNAVNSTSIIQDSRNVHLKNIAEGEGASDSEVYDFNATGYAGLNTPFDLRYGDELSFDFVKSSGASQIFIDGDSNDTRVWVFSGDLLVTNLIDSRLNGDLISTYSSITDGDAVSYTGEVNSDSVIDTIGADTGATAGAYIVDSPIYNVKVKRHYGDNTLPALTSSDWTLINVTETGGEFVFSTPASVQSATYITEWDDSTDYYVKIDLTVSSGQVKVQYLGDGATDGNIAILTSSGTHYLPFNSSDFGFEFNRDGQFSIFSNLGDAFDGTIHSVELRKKQSATTPLDLPINEGTGSELDNKGSDNRDVYDFSLGGGVLDSAITLSAGYKIFMRVVFPSGNPTKISAFFDTFDSVNRSAVRIQETGDILFFGGTAKVDGVSIVSETYIATDGKVHEIEFTTDQEIGLEFIGDASFGNNEYEGAIFDVKLYDNNDNLIHSYDITGDSATVSDGVGSIDMTISNYDANQQYKLYGANIEGTFDEANWISGGDLKENQSRNYYLEKWANAL